LVVNDTGDTGMTDAATALSSIQPDLDLARSLFAELEATRTGRGFTRATYGDGENFAHAAAERVARRLGLTVETDAAMNLYMTLPGQDRDLPRLVTGSHMDSVPQGGNFDGAAGVIAGLAAVAGFRARDVVPPRDVTVMAIRAEEAVWFDFSYIGSHAAFGKLAPKALVVRRSDTGLTLAEHMAESGCEIEALERGEAHLTPDRVAAFIEVHIEQGPVLEQHGLPIGLVTGIRGCLRHAEVACLGAYAHSGAAPRSVRRDAVAASVELVYRLGQKCLEMEAAGDDLVFTVGRFFTDPEVAGASKVAGEARFSLDFRGLADAPMFAASQSARDIAADIAQRHNVSFQLGEPSYSTPAALDPALRQRLAGLAAESRVPFMELASGAGHDAAVFSAMGVPTGMIFIRNANGSHNPDEAMDMADFADAARLLANFMATA
jgi:N-carbamoyl-L-amino-acid hydrolase